MSHGNIGALTGEMIGLKCAPSLNFWDVAGVAELADALDLGSSFFTEVWVQVPPPAPEIKQ